MAIESDRFEPIVAPSEKARTIQLHDPTITFTIVVREGASAIWATFSCGIVNLLETYERQTAESYDPIATDTRWRDEGSISPREGDVLFRIIITGHVGGSKMNLRHHFRVPKKKKFAPSR
jgi:hypothetical protein